MAHALEQLDDADLARRARGGESDCFAEIARRYQVPLMRFLARRMPLARADAEDLVQDTFVRAYESLGQYREAWPLRTWLYTICHRLAISHARKRRPQSAESVGGGRAAAGESPVQRAGRQDENQQLWAVARSILTEEQFNAVWLYYVEEMPAGEVAQVLNRSWVSVKTMLHRARKRLMPHAARVTGRTQVLVGDETVVEAGDV